jgi:uncharacterized protein (TIGR03435 family)
MRLSWVIALFSAGAAFAQPSTTTLAYEAASVKLDTSGRGSTDIDGTRGQIMIKNITLHRLVELAYSVSPAQVMGPDWMENVRFDVAAKYPPDTNMADRWLMLRGLLAERFKLAVHRESKEVQGYALVVAKGGFKLKPVEAGGNNTDHTGGTVQTLNAKSTSIASFAGLAARYVGAVVVDKTGIDGVYDFQLRWTTDSQSADDPDAPPPFPVAIQEALGLRLQARKVPAEVIVVDRVERAPTEN